MVAWDSVVGHHMGLAHAHASFTKTFKKTSTDEVRELYRHGIVHGMLVNYDNEYVGAKAWNRLCAVRDWATSMRNAAEPPKPQPSVKETMRKVDHNRRTREALDAWKPGEVSAADEGLDTDEVVVAARAYLHAWIRRNYGAMGALVGQRFERFDARPDRARASRTARHGKRTAGRPGNRRRAPGRSRVSPAAVMRSTPGDPALDMSPARRVRLIRECGRELWRQREHLDRPLQTLDVVTPTLFEPEVAALHQATRDR